MVERLEYHLAGSMEPSSVVRKEQYSVVQMGWPKVEQRDSSMAGLTASLKAEPLADVKAFSRVDYSGGPKAVKKGLMLAGS